MCYNELLFFEFFDTFNDHIIAFISGNGLLKISSLPFSLSLSLALIWKKVREIIVSNVKITFLLTFRNSILVDVNGILFI